LRTCSSPDAIVFIEGSVDRRREEPSVRISNVISIHDAQHQLARCVVLDVQSLGKRLDAVMDVRKLCWLIVANAKSSSASPPALGMSPRFAHSTTLRDRAAGGCA
jgi:hypothetical protein